MKNVAKIEIVLHDPYSNALWGGLEGVSFAIKLFWKMIFLKTI